MNDELLTADEVADRLRVKPDTIVVWARQGRIPAHRLSRKVIRFRLNEVIAALDVTTAVTSASHSACGPEGEP